MSKNSGVSYTETIDQLSFDMIAIPGGSFWMGSYEFETSQPAKKIHLNGYYMCKVQVTQALWEAIMGTNPSQFKGEKLPVDQVNWHEVKDFLSKLNAKTGKNYRLPSESEWEYAAEGGEEFDYAGSDRLKAVGWCKKFTGGKPREVGLLAPNGYGLHDMSGNVWEWCEDASRSIYYASYADTPDDGTPATDPSWEDRVLRGGGYLGTPDNCKIGFRNFCFPHIGHESFGFRLAHSLE